MRGLLSFLTLSRTVASQGSGRGSGILVALLTLAIAMIPYLNEEKIKADLAEVGAFVEEHKGDAIDLAKRTGLAISDGAWFLVKWYRANEEKVEAMRAWSAERIERLANTLGQDSRDEAQAAPVPESFDIGDAASAVRLGVGVPISEEDEIALISIAQTMGPRNFLASEGLVRINAGDISGAVAAFGQVL